MKNLKTVLAAILCIAVIIGVAAFAGTSTVTPQTGFRYQHDPLANPKAMEDIVLNSKAIYGYSPDPESARLGEYAKYDWTDPTVVEAARQDRIAYHESILSMRKMLDEMTSAGMETEEIARAISAERNRIRIDSYHDDPEGLATLRASNLEKYGNEDGPTADSLFEKYGDWETVIIKSFSPNLGMDACLGLYDDNYELYVQLGLAP